MPRLPKFTGKKLVRVLRKNRFVLDHITGSHFVFRHPETGRRVIIPVHHKELPPGTLLSILKQTGLSRDDLAEK